MGKTSLAHRAIELDTELRTDLVFVHLSLSTYEKGLEVFRALITETFQMVERRLSTSANLNLEDLRGMMDAANGTEDWYDLRNAMRAFFRALRDAPVFVSVVLDEFDRATAIFDSVVHFQFLRDLATEPFASTGLITVSRRPIKLIELDAVSSSTLDGVLALRQTVGPFTDAEVDEMLRRSAEVGADLLQVRDELVANAGSHPYLLELLCYETIEGYLSEGTIDVAAAIARTRPQFHDQFVRMIKLIDSDTAGAGLKLLRRVCTGEDVSYWSEDLDVLLRLGLLNEADGQVTTFSPAFARFFVASCRTAGPSTG